MKKKEQRTPYVIIACTLLGMLVGSLLIYFIQGKFPIEVFVGGLFVAIILTTVEITKMKRKKVRLPRVDERVIQNVFHFFAYASHITLALLFIILATFSLLGNETISTLYLWILFFCYLWIVGIGVVIVKKR